jgi:hypothetical protein
MNVKSDRVCPKIDDRDPHSVILSTFWAAKKESAKFNPKKISKNFPTRVATSCVARKFFATLEESGDEQDAQRLLAQNLIT